MLNLIKGGKYQAQQLLEARWWIADCSWRADDLSELSDEEVIEKVDRHYEGGWKQFCRDIDQDFTAD
jgi:hypothetical protein